MDCAAHTYARLIHCHIASHGGARTRHVRQGGLRCGLRWRLVEVGTRVCTAHLVAHDAWWCAYASYADRCKEVRLVS